MNLSESILLGYFLRGLSYGYCELSQADTHRVCHPIAPAGWKELDVAFHQNGTHCLAELYWTAPELLRLQELPWSGTPQGDVYSFAVLMRDLIHQQAHGPFDDLEEAPEGKAGVCCSWERE